MKDRLKMEEEERKWYEERKKTDWDEFYKYTKTCNYDFKLHFEAAGEHEHFKEIIHDFYEKIVQEGVNLLVKYEYYRYIKQRKRWEIRLHLVIGIPTTDEYEGIFDKYREIVQRIHELEYTHLKEKLPKFEVTYEYYKEITFE